MKKPDWNTVKAHWLSLVAPIMTVFCLYLLLRLAMMEVPFFIKVTPQTLQGQVPQVRYIPSWTLKGALVAFILFNAFLFQTLRQWARYYLNRKLVLSYLFFALVPLLTNLCVFVGGISTWMGLSNTFLIEKNLELHSRDLERLSKTIQTRLADSTDTPTTENGLSEIWYSAPTL